MAKTRQPNVTNEEGLKLLEKAGIIDRYNLDKTCQFSKYIKSNNYYNKSKTLSYYIPVEYWKKYVRNSYRIFYKKGTLVRFNERTTRSTARSRWGQDVGDIYNWEHLGIGTGKIYQAAIRNKVATDSFSINAGALTDPNASVWYKNNVISRLKQFINQKIIPNNPRYCLNLNYADNKAKILDEKGVRLDLGSGWWNKKQKPQAKHFMEYTEIDPSGVLGPKKLINGVITKVFVHFLYPTWESKRESRYEVTFDTGAKAIFTGDHLRTVFDTDYEIDEVLMDACQFASSCPRGASCEHSKVHLETPDCYFICELANSTCVAIYDYTELPTTTYGKALEYEDDEIL